MAAPHTGAWWRDAVIYQVYPRSFADADGDGVGDIAGIRARLGHIRELGADAVWISPWYVSPMADHGYDVADYRDIDPLFGTRADAEALIAEAREAGLRIVVDLVPNHCSDRHPWFRAAVAAGPGSPERELFHFRPGRGEGGELPPNDWPSNFGGPAWSRITEPDGRPGEWYLRMFAAGQPDWNWDHPAVREEFASVLRFWLDRGVAGFRIDVADYLAKAPGLPDRAEYTGESRDPWSDQDAVHEIYRGWRRVLDSYDGERVFVAELWNDDPVRFARYLRPDELHSAFNFPFLQARWDARAMREVIDATIAEHALVGAPTTWVLSNHDTTRHVTRYGRVETGYGFNRAELHGTPVDLELGTRRARAAALLTMALPGCVYIYQGDELGLWEVEDIPMELRQDPAVVGTGGADPGRDGCRVPIPWDGDRAPYGFSPPDADAGPWLPQPADWKAHTVAAQTGDPDSSLELYRRALAVRRAEPALGDGTLTWLPAPGGVLSFTRGQGLVCTVNLSGEPAELPPHTELLLTSGPLDHGLLPPDTTVWLRGAE
ncbi:glycoside hydrolase family 13 protein [Streptomyces sp. NBC_01619]|uniref:Glycoside hydrolase family 13 protein n=1 Tax=Streptomyces pratisoli TaxID=3139917 RepID=A0ACC6QSA3_9ACTN|nr:MULTISPECIES: glycoside hydrolase family 13 protein [unclassified Streptomyces]MCX4514071.1 glycoside hydrolase family 13 protein [Streptomyces sp. NBC_01619]